MYVEVQSVAPAQDTPRGALIAAELFSRLMKRLAHHPETPARVHDIASVRELAHQVENTDPGFAADLYAAAARHEGLGD
ncbi:MULTISPECIES: hypothetical protein [Rubrivivax]|nr:MULTISPECIES: hypothetical protein [Rubrivivax]MCC9596869.1 hypothetical protein [Rubrivivax sp. JA1055]MCC9649025.1 hypothetical protein [Rubrivivax sp. JA1029]MCD0421184.1 hypothetical protein [Rubrivivax sp. JA1024]